MKVSVFRLMSLILAIVLLIVAVPLVKGECNIFANAQTVVVQNSGDTIEMGTYPQSKVTDTVLLSRLGLIENSLIWFDYGYYYGNGTLGSMAKNNFMQYSDIVFDGAKYRAVRFSLYRSSSTFYKPVFVNSSQDNNGYYLNKIYWFKYEPLKWTVINPDNGTVMCSSIIDAQAFNNSAYQNGSLVLGTGQTINAFWNDATKTAFANNWAASDLRSWLNNSFYNTSFTNEQKQCIIPSVLNNPCVSNSVLSSESTSDNVYILSYDDIQNTINENNINDSVSSELYFAQASDYAKCQGLSVNNSKSNWRLRSAANNTISTYYVTFSGDIQSSLDVCNISLSGIRPVIKLADLSSYEYIAETPISATEIQISKSSLTLLTGDKYQLCADVFPINASIKSVAWTSSDLSVASVDETGKVTAISNGECTITALASDGGYSESCTLSVICRHSNIIWITDAEPCCTQSGAKQSVCADCSQVIDTVQIPFVGHTLFYVNAQEPSCINDGKIEHWYCEACGKCFTDNTCLTEIEYINTIIKSPGHSMSKWATVISATCTEQGMRARNCANCNYYETEDISALGHNLSFTPALRETCLQQGNTDFYLCSRCNNYYSDETAQNCISPYEVFITKLKHIPSDWIVTTPNSCTDKGYRSKICTVCNTVLLTETINASSHTDNNSDGICDVCFNPMSLDSAREIQFVCAGNLYYTVENNKEVNNTQKLYFSKYVPVTFMVQTNAKSQYSDYIVKLNGETVFCDANGKYTIFADNKNAVVTIEEAPAPVMYAPQKNTSEIKQFFINLFSKIASFFSLLFSGKK